MKKVLEPRKLKIYCTGCNAKIDVTNQVSFSQVNCPACNTLLTVPKQMGNVSLLEKVRDSIHFESFRGLIDGEEVIIKVIKDQSSRKLINNDKFDIRTYEDKTVVVTPHYGKDLEPLQHSNTAVSAMPFIKICDALQEYTENNFYFSEIDPKIIQSHEDQINLDDAVLNQLMNGDNNNDLSSTVREAGKVFNYLLFDHREDYEKWTEKYLLHKFENNYFQFPWMVKGEKYEDLRVLIRHMILKPESFNSFSQLKKKILQALPSTKTPKTAKSKKKSATLSVDKSNKNSKIVENKANRSIRRTKNNKGSYTTLLAIVLITVVLVSVFALNTNNSKDSGAQTLAINEDKNKENLKKDREWEEAQQRKRQEEKNKLERLKLQKQVAHLDEASRKKEMARLAELQRKREAEKQEDLKNFLAVINPPDEVKKKFNALPDVSSSHLLSLMNKHCNDCHNSKKRKGDFVLDSFTQQASIYRDYEVIKHAYESVKLGDMPPDDEDISDSERQSLVDYFEKIIYTLESKQIDVKSSALIRRLTPYEYDYTVKDITGLDLKLGETFPGDGGGNQGFSNDASLMGVSPIQMEKFLNAAEEIANYSDFDLSKGFYFNKKKSVPPTTADYERKLEQELYKIYKIYPRNFSITRNLPQLMWAAVEKIKNKNADLKSIAAKKKVSYLFLSRLNHYLHSSGIKSQEEIKALAKWKKLSSLRFKKPDDHKETIKKAINDFIGKYLKSKLELANKQNKNRFKHLSHVKNIESIFHLDENTASKIISGKDLIKYNQTIEHLNFLRFTKDNRFSKDIYLQLEPHVNKFLTKVFRRPPGKSKLSKMTNDLLKDSLKYGMPLASRIFITRAFSSFNFTFRIEEKNSRKIDDFDLASRLSYFLWAGPPDSELLTLASNGKLNDESTLSLQIKRMLKSSKSDRLAKHFASQWLRFGDILEFDGPSEKVFKGFDKNLAKDMWQESAMSFNYIVKNDRSLLEIFNADYTFVNRRLSNLYGLNQRSPAFKKVTVTNGQRGGILGHASILTMTSFGQRTSPIIRGNWILSVLLGTPTPPPPMDVDALPEEDVISENFTLKQQLAKHRDNPACSGCHKKIDPLGIVLENYDVVGRWRTRYQKAKVDSESTISGKILNGPSDLKKHLLKNKIQFIRNLSKKLLSYSLGRSIYYYDNYLVNKMIENAIRNDYEFSSLVKTIILSPQFQLK